MKNLMSKLGIAFSAVLLGAGSAFAASALPVGWDTVVTDAQTDATTVVITFILAGIAISALWLIAKRR